MSVSTPLCTAASMALAAGVWCPSCRLVTASEFLLQLDTFSTCITTRGQNQDMVLQTVLGLSRQLIGKCQMFTYIKYCRYIGLSSYSSSYY